MEADKIYAICYLHQANDERNKCLLTGKDLVVVRQGKTYRFPLIEIKRIAFGHRRVMLPLVAGGIVAPLSLLAIYTYHSDPWLMLPLFFLGLFALYWGWMGYPALLIKDGVREHDFQLLYISPNMQAFAAFASSMVETKKNKGEKAVIYHIAERTIWEQARQAEEPYSPASIEKEGFIHASDPQQLEWVKHSGWFTADKEWVILAIDPLKVNPEIRYEPGAILPGMTEAQAQYALFPHIYGPLNPDAIVSTEPLHF